MPNDSVIQSSSDVLGGAPVFARTRVPVQTLIDYIEAGERIDDFIADFPTVSREQVLQVLEIAKRSLVAGAHETTSG